MKKSSTAGSVILNIQERFIIFMLYSAILFLLYNNITGSWVPVSGGNGIWLISALAFLAFDLLSAPFFVKPSDVLASGLSVLLLLWSIDLNNASYYFSIINKFRWISIAVILIIITASIISIILNKPEYANRIIMSKIARISYLFSINWGKSELIFTPPILISIYGFYLNQPSQMLWLGFTWIIIAIIKPIELIYKTIRYIDRLNTSVKDKNLIGNIQRIDSPNIVRASISSRVSWNTNEVKVGCFIDSKQAYILPLFSQLQGSGLIGTGIYIESGDEIIKDITPGYVYTPAQKIERTELIKQLTSIDIASDLIGFVVENSNILNICFEMACNKTLRKGCLVFCRQEDTIIYYQVLDACTTEESFEQNPRGTHIVSATQLGILTPNDGFKKYEWLPAMNTPIFLPLEDVKNTAHSCDGGFEIGVIPNTNILIETRFGELISLHTAILGITGTGKTELAFDIIRHALKNDTKVFCVDFTADYRERLKDLHPESLGLEQCEIEDLDILISKVETGKYGAPDEKKALYEFISGIKPGVKEQIDCFLRPAGSRLGIFDLTEIANTRATLRATELFLSNIFEWAKDNRKARKILIVLEEAHTVIPEMNIFGYDRGDTQAVVGRMAQIALQGRKYGVGLLIISQRTALVSKSILSQCNTYITFSLVDKTSLEYLSSIYSPEHVKVIPSLLPRQALIFGKGIKSERPIVIDIPYDEDKKKASETLNIAIELVEETAAAIEDKEQSFLED